ncbi:MAG: Sec-independent protein translocase protein TatB [Pseudomonadales bacterium]
MFDIGFPELMIVAVVMLLVLGPERLPETLRMLGLWLGRLRRSFNSVKTEIEKEIGMDEIKRQLHNEAIMDEMKRLESEVRDSVEEPTANTVDSSTNEMASAGAQEPLAPDDEGENPTASATLEAGPVSAGSAEANTELDSTSSKPS